jgi:hypothetical protein
MVSQECRSHAAIRADDADDLVVPLRCSWDRLTATLPSRFGIGAPELLLIAMPLLPIAVVIGLGFRVWRRR